MKATIYLTLIFISLGVFSQTKQKPGETEPAGLSNSYLEGETWPAELLATDLDRYVTNRMAAHRRFIDHVFLNLDQYTKQDAELSEEMKENEASNYTVRGADFPHRVELAAGLSHLTSSYFPDYNAPSGYKSRLLGVGFPVDQLHHLELSLEETLPEWLKEADRQAAASLPAEHYLSSDAQIRAYYENLNDLEWAVKTHWALTFLERFSPESRATLVRFVGEYVAPTTNATYRSPNVTPYMIKSFRRRASYNHEKYCWPTTKAINTTPSEFYSKNGDYLEWISAEKFSDYLFGKEACSNQTLSNEIDFLRKTLPKAVERGKRMNLPIGCELTSNLFPYIPQRSTAKIASKSAVVFIGRVTQKTPGLYRNRISLANSLLTVEIKTWLRKPEGEPGDTYHVMNGHAQFSLGPYQLCSEPAKYQDIPVNSMVLVFSSYPPFGVSGTLLSVWPDQLYVLDDESQSTKKWGVQESMKLETLKSILDTNAYNKNEHSEQYL